MELDLLPENNLLQVVSNLDLLELVRCSRVSRRWRDLCQIAVETTVRSLPLSRPEFWRLNGDSLASILHLCTANLEEIDLPTLKNQRHHGKKADADQQVKLNVSRWCPLMSEFRFVNLKHLNLGDASTDRTCVETILSSTSKLESFTWLTPDPNGLEFGGTEPFTWSCSSIRRVNLGCLFATDTLFSSLARNCPKLEHFTANAYFRQWTAAGLDNLCGSCRKLKVLDLKVSNSLTSKGMYVVPILFDAPKLTTDLTHFWSLGQLRYLSLPFEGGLIDDEALYRISLSFPELHTLKFGDTTLSNDGVANLRRLKNLRNLSITHVTGTIDEGIMELAAAGLLERLNLALTQINFSTVLFLLDRCSGLKCLNLIRSVSNYLVHRGTTISTQQAHRIIDLRTRIGDFDGEAECCTLVHNDPAVWTSASVRYALEKMPEQSALRVMSLSDYSNTGEEEDCC